MRDPEDKHARPSRLGRDRPAGALGRETRWDIRVRLVAVPRAHLGGDTDAPHWRSDPRLLAILARGLRRSREGPIPP